MIREHVRLERLLKVDAEEAFGGEELQGVLLGEGVDVRMAGYGAGCKGTAELVYPVEKKTNKSVSQSILVVYFIQEERG